MEELKRVHLRPLVSGDFIIDGITYKGQHIEKKLDVPVSYTHLTLPTN